MLKGVIDFNTCKQLTIEVAGIYIVWILLHYVSSHLYVYFCTQCTILGFLMSPFVALAPHCSAMRWLIYVGGNNISLMWTFIGSWLMKKLVLG